MHHEYYNHMDWYSLIDLLNLWRNNMTQNVKFEIHSRTFPNFIVDIHRLLVTSASSLKKINLVTSYPCLPDTELNLIFPNIIVIMVIHPMPVNYILQMNHNDDNIEQESDSYISAQTHSTEIWMSSWPVC